MRRVWWSVAVTSLFLVFGIFGIGNRKAEAQFGPPKFVKVSATAPKTVVAGKPFVLTVNVTVDKPYHIQANKTKEGYIPTVVEVGAPGFTVGKIVYPKSQQATMGHEKLDVYAGSVAIKVTLTPDKTVKAGKASLPVTVKYQGCNDQSCFPPTKAVTNAAVTVKAGTTKKAEAVEGTLILAQDRSTSVQTGAGAADAVSVPGFRGTKITQFMEVKPFVEWLKRGGSQAGNADLVTELLTKGGARNTALALGLIYLLGLALNLTPCVYPLIPITIGYFGRQAANGAKTGGLSICYALGMALMYSVLGIFAALAGKVFGSWLNNPYVLVGFAVLMFALGVSMFDRPDGRPIWEMQLPSSLTSQAKSRAGYLGALLMGLMVGIVAAPCIGPVVVALIQVIGSTRNVALGLGTFFTLGVGLSTPYLLLGFGLIKALPRAGEWMVAVKHIFGLLLFGMGIYYLRDLLGPQAYRYTITIFAVLAGVYLLLLDKSGSAAVKFQRFKQGVGIAAIALGIFLFVPKAQAKGIAFEALQPDIVALQKRLDQAKKAHKEVLLDFNATWCAACKELDERTFRTPEAAKATEGFVLLKMPLEDFESDKVKPFLKTFGIVGLPTVVHLVPDNGSDSVALRD